MPPPPCRSICLRRRMLRPRLAWRRHRHRPRLRPVSRRHSHRPRSASHCHSLRGQVLYSLRGRPAACRPRRRAAIRCQRAAPLPLFHHRRRIPYPLCPTPFPNLATVGQKLMETGEESEVLVYDDGLPMLQKIRSQVRALIYTICFTHIYAIFQSKNGISEAINEGPNS